METFVKKKYSLYVLLKKWSTVCHEIILSRDSAKSNSRYEIVAIETRFNACKSVAQNINDI